MEQIAKLLASDGRGSDQFGDTVSIDGLTAVVGSSNHDNGGTQGAAYVFRRIGGEWMEIAKLEPDKTDPESRFAESVSISGETAIVGAPDENNGGIASGAAHIYRDIDGVWERIATITPDDAASGQEFGFRVRIDGNTAAVTASGDDEGCPDQFCRSGSVYVFREIKGQWEQITKLTAEEPRNFDFFGNGLAIDGNTIAVGAEGDDVTGNFTDDGSVYVFREDEDGVWEAVSNFASTSPDSEDDSMGRSLDLDGDTIIAGARSAEPFGTRSGAAFIFREDENLGWRQIAELNASDGAPFDIFGISVAIEGDTVLVGASGDDTDRGSAAGSAYLFREIDGVWQERVRFSAEDTQGGDQFGIRVDIDGNRGLVGAFFDDDNGSASGAAFVFALGRDCPADLTGPGGDGEPDGSLTADDFFFYLGLFADGDLAADLTGPGGDGEPDGSLTADDFFFYLGLFSAGCP